MYQLAFHLFSHRAPSMGQLYASGIPSMQSCAPAQNNPKEDTLLGEELQRASGKIRRKPSERLEKAAEPVSPGGMCLRVCRKSARFLHTLFTGGMLYYNYNYL